jgi:hypothetical protein
MPHRESRAFSWCCAALEGASSETMFGAAEGALSRADVHRLLTAVTVSFGTLGLVLPGSPLFSVGLCDIEQPPCFSGSAMALGPSSWFAGKSQNMQRGSENVLNSTINKEQVWNWRGIGCGTRTLV